MPKTVTKKLGAKKVAAKKEEVIEAVDPEITVPEIEVEEPKKEEVFVEKTPVLGKLGLVNVRLITKKVIQGREVNEVYCEDGTTYLLNDADMAKQFKAI
jgi:hypothetical protein